MSASWFSISKSTLISILTKLQTVFDTKADSSHTHTKSDITDFAHDHPLSIEAASTATSAINLDPNAIYKLTAGGKTFIFKTPADSDHYAWADITGKPSSYPPSAHTHTVSQITDFPSTMPPSSHTHGNIQNGGTLQTNDVAIANGDKLVVTDSSDSSKIARASIAFDGSTATKCLTQKGTWENFLSSHQDISGKVNKTGDTMSGQLNINESTTDTALRLNVKSGSSGCYVEFKVGGTNKGYFYLDGTDAGVYFTSKKPLAYRSEIPTTLPASDVYAWAKASTKPSYTLDEVSDGSTRKLANYLPLSGGTMTGTLNLYENNVSLNFRSGNGEWSCTSSYQTAGNEALVFATKKDESSFIFVNGEDSITNHDNNRWQSLTPALQIKKNCVAINKLIANQVDPSYTLDVNGSINGTSVKVNGTNVLTALPSHTHGNIQNGGTLQTNDIAIASGDKLVVTDSSDSSKIARASISFDGSTATKCLTQKGTWESFTNNANNAVTQTGSDSSTSAYEVLFSATADNTDRTEGARKSSKMTFHPANAQLKIYAGNNSTKLFFEAYGNGTDTGTASQAGLIALGNSTATGTSGSRHGVLKLYSKQSYYSEILTADTYTANRTFTLPDKTGTIALTSDIVDTKVTQTVSDSSTYNSGYKLLFSATADSTTRTEEARKSSKLMFNPYAGRLFIHNAGDKGCFTLDAEAYTVSTSATVARLTVGNNTASGTAGNRYASLRLYSKKSGYVDLEVADNTAKYTATLQAKTGTIALTSDIPKIVKKTINLGSATMAANSAYAYNFDTGLTQAQASNIISILIVPTQYHGWYAVTISANSGTTVHWGAKNLYADTLTDTWYAIIAYYE